MSVEIRESWGDMRLARQSPYNPHPGDATAKPSPYIALWVESLNQEPRRFQPSESSAFRPGRMSKEGRFETGSSLTDAL
jgi:hypothetical protein